MRTLYVEIQTGEEKEIEKKGKKGRFSVVRMVPVVELFKLEIPDNAKVTLQGMNPTNAHKGNANPAVLRVYIGNKVQIACIPDVIGFREDTIKVSRLQDRENVVGKSWVEVKDNPMFDPGTEWQPISNNEDDELEDF